MSEKKLFDTVEALVTLKGEKGNFNFKIEGKRVPAEMKDVPGYIGEQIREVLVGSVSGRDDKMAKRLVDMQKKIDELIAENKKLKTVKKY